MVRAAVRQVEDWTATWFDIWPVRVDEFLGEIFSPKLLQMLSEWLTDIMSGCICQGIIQYGGKFPSDPVCIGRPALILLFQIILC